MDGDALARRLAGGDRRSIGAADAVAAEAAEDPSLLASLVGCLAHADPCVRMRAADALEKAGRRRPGDLTPFKEAILEAARDDLPEVRWHAAQMIGRLDWAPEEARAVAERLDDLLQESASRIARASALEALVELARRHPPLRPGVRWRVEAALNSPIPSLAARARRLAKRLPTE